MAFDDTFGGTLGAGFLLLISAAGAHATVYTVPGSSPTVQGAINIATSGDTVLVSPGTYHEAINFLGKNLTLQSTGGAAVTTIVAPAMTPVVQITSGENNGAVLDGFTLTGGRPSFDAPYFGDGGGIYIDNSAPTVTRNIITGNIACRGGGIQVNFSDAVISGNTIANNRADCSQLAFTGLFWGGAISLQGAASAQVSGNTMTGNIAEMGSAVGMNSAGTPSIRGNVMMHNVAGGGGCLADGGTIGMINASDADIVQNVIAYNDAGSCGGIAFLAPSGARGPAIVNNTIAYNGGSVASGIYAEGFDSAARIVNNIVLAPPGATAMFCADVYAVGPPIMQNNVLFSDGGVAASGFCAPQMGQNGNIAADPKLMAPATGNFYLYADSPALDSGTSADALIPAVDFTGAPRVQDGNGDGVAAIDMGAYETPVPGPLVVQRAESVRIHGSATYGLALSLDPSAPTIEPRLGPVQNLVLTFNKAINAAAASISEGTAFANAPTFAGVTLTVNLTAVSDQQYVTVMLANIAALDGQTGGAGSVRIGFLAGDVNQSGAVTIADLALVNAALTQVVTSANFLKDVNASGTLSLADKGHTNANLTKGLPPP